MKTTPPNEHDGLHAKETDTRTTQDPANVGFSWRSRAWRLALLILLATSGAALFSMIFKGFATTDSVLYALGLKSVLAGGVQEIRHAFNGEMSFGYYLLLEGLVRIRGNTGDPSGLMNATSATFAFILQGLLFLLIARILRNPVGAIIACLAVLLAPGVWFLSHYGHPTVPALTFFAGSLLALDYLITDPVPRPGLLWLLFILLATAALILRFDILLTFGAYVGLLHLRRALSRAMLVKVVGALAVVLLLVVGLRVLTLGYLINPEGGTIAYHLSNRLVAASLPRTVLKNTVLWAVSANALVVVLALAGLARRDVRSRFGLLLVFAAAPWAVFLPFQHMDMGRLIASTTPILALVAVALILSLFKRATSLALIIMLVLAQILSVAFYPLVTRLYDFRREIDGRALAAVPLGFPPVDQIYRQRAVTGQGRFAQEVSTEHDSDVLIVGRAGLMGYRFRLESSREVIASGKTVRNGVVIDSMATPQNRFYFIDLDVYPSGAQPIKGTLAYLGERPIKVHLMPFWREYPTSGTRCFLDPQELQAVLERESSRAL